MTTESLTVILQLDQTFCFVNKMYWANALYQSKIIPTDKRKQGARRLARELEIDMNETHGDTSIPNRNPNAPIAR